MHRCFKWFWLTLQLICAFGQLDALKILQCQSQFALPRGGYFSHPSFPNPGNAWRIYTRQGADPNGGPDGVLAAKVGVIVLQIITGADPNATDMYGLQPKKRLLMVIVKEGVEILFHEHVDWSIDGVTKHVNSEKFRKMIRKEKIFLEAKSMCVSAFRRQNHYCLAHVGTQALEIDPSGAAGLSNRSLHFVYLSKGGFSLEECCSVRAGKARLAKGS